ILRSCRSFQILANSRYCKRNVVSLWYNLSAAASSFDQHPVSPQNIMRLILIIQEVNPMGTQADLSQKSGI
ncbi:MAG: hypothetical protein PHT43_02545, partial [Anaerolineaceae bacterium]|nr:hypothetical protein [Anaerolineaceae bacterium]